MTCSVDGCDREVHARGVCFKHYRRLRRYGSTDAVKPNHNASKTHCKHGHPFDAENTYIKPNGARQCKRCVLNRTAQYRREDREADRAWFASLGAD